MVPACTDDKDSTERNQESPVPATGPADPPATTSPRPARVRCTGCSTIDGELIRDFAPSDGYFLNPRSGRKSKQFLCRLCYEAEANRATRQEQQPPVVVTTKLSDYWYFDENTHTYKPGQPPPDDGADDIDRDVGGEG